MIELAHCMYKHQDQIDTVEEKESYIKQVKVNKNRKGGRKGGGGGGINGEKG